LHEIEEQFITHKAFSYQFVELARFF
jgi:hypothetical protein